jgi:hypothetical protein
MSAVEVSPELQELGVAYAPGAGRGQALGQVSWQRRTSPDAAPP